MREDIICILPSTIQDDQETAISNNVTENIDMQETDDSTYYSEIMEFLHYESDADAKRLDEWASKKSGDPAKWLRVMRRRVRNYFLVEGQLFHGHRGNRSRRHVVVGAGERRAILEGAHIQPGTGVHVGVSKMYAALCASYFWQGLYRDVKDFVRNCGHCVEIPGNSIAVSNCLSRAGIEMEARVEEEGVSHPEGTTTYDGHSCMETCTTRKQPLGGQVWERVEVNVLSAPLEHQGNRSMLVLADPVSHWISAQALAVDSAAVDISEAAALFAFSTFCTFGFPSACSVVCESGIVKEAMWEKLKSLMEPMKLDWVPKKKKAALLKKGESTIGAKAQSTGSSAVDGIPLESEGQVLPSPVITLHSSPCSSSLCKWAWESVRAYMCQNAESWHIGLEAFLFDERRRASVLAAKSAFSLMFGRAPVMCSGGSLDERKPRRRKLRSSILECRHCEEHFTSKISFQIHQRKHTEEAQWRGLGEEEYDDENRNEGNSVTHVSPWPPHPKLAPGSSEGPSLRRAPINSLSGLEDAATKPGKKAIAHHCSKSTSCGWRKTHLKIGGMKKQCQRGISRLLALAQVGIGPKAAGDKIPRDSQRASFTAQTVASVKASLEAKRKKHMRRGNYQRYSQELREEIAKHALSNGISHTMKHFSSTLGGKPISESTIRNFVRSYCSPAKSHLSNCLQNKDLGEEIGRFSACAGTEAAVRYYSSRLGVEVKCGTVSRLRRAYLKKHSPPEEGRGVVLRKKGEVTRRKRRYGALLRDEIGNYAAQHGVRAAMQHYSERLLFPVRERTITKFLKMYLEKESHKNPESNSPCKSDPHHNASLLGSSTVCPTTAHPSTTSSTPPPLHQGSIAHPNPLLGNSSEVLDEASGSLVMYGSYASLASQPQVVGYHDSSLPSYDVHSTGQAIILDQGVATTTTGFCNSQELGYHHHHSTQGYSPENFGNSVIPTSTSGSMGMDHQTPVPSNGAISHEGMGTTHHVPMPHITSPYGSMMTISHQLMDNSHGAASGILNDHTQVIVAHNGGGNQDHMPSQSAMESNSTLMSVLPNSSFVHHTKSQELIPSPLMNQGGVDGNLLASTDMTSFQKTMESEMLPSYYPLTMTSGHTYQIGNNIISASLQISKDNPGQICGGSQTLILGESLMPASALENENSKSNPKEILCISGEVCDKPSCFVRTTQERDAGALVGEEGVEIGTTSFQGGESLPLEENPVDSTATVPKGGRRERSSKGVKKKVKYPQKSKRGSYNFLSPELRARIGRYAAEHGNLKTAKHFEAEVGRQIPESTIRGLRDKYVMKQMHVTSSAQASEGASGDSSQQVTALGYAPRGRPMVLGKYDEVVQDCMHELVKAGEKVGSTLAIATARQVLTQYEPSLLEEFGGPIRLNNSWAKSFIKRIGLSNNS